MTQEFEELRPQLFALAYRMTGAPADAEDIVQDAYIRWQSADRSDVRSPRSFLNAVVARLSLDALKSAQRTRETYVGTWLPEPLVSGKDDSPAAPVELADSLSVAFLHVLESLSPAERVAFVMREVFGEEYRDVAAVLETTEANCRQLVARAKQQVQGRRPRYTVDPERHQAVLREFLAACATDNKSTLMHLLRDDAVLYSDGGGKAAAAINPIFGSEHISRFMLGVTRKGGGAEGTEAVPIYAGGSPSVYLVRNGVTHSLINLDLDEDGRIRTVYIIRNPDKLTAISPSSSPENAGRSARNTGLAPD